MIDLSKIAYRLTVMDSGGKQYNIKEFVTGLGWEENKMRFLSELHLQQRMIRHLRGDYQS